MDSGVAREAALKLMLLDIDAAPGDATGTGGRFRAGQLGSLLRYTPALMIGNIVSALGFVLVAWRTESASVLILWAGLVIALSLFLAANAWRNRNKHFATASIAAIRRAEAYASVLGVLWAAFPPLFFEGAPADLQNLIIAILLASAGIGAFAMARIPSAAVIYAWLLLASLAIVAFRIGTSTGLAFGALSLGYGVLLSSMILAKHRSALQRAASDADFERRGEIISLLLKDFERESSDWLWETNAEGKLSYFSERFADLLGRETARLHGASLKQAAGVEGEHPAWSSFAEAMAEHQPVRDLQLPLGIRQDANWWMVTAKPMFSARGDFIGYRGVGRDITQKRKAEADLVTAKDSAEAANAAKSQFLATMSHELKTPLNAIVGFSDLLGIPHDLHGRPENQREYIKAIRDGGQHLRVLIDDILDATRIEKGTFKIIEQECDLAELAEIAAKMCRDLAAAGNVTIAASLVDGVEVEGDATRIKQVLINLITNAVKFSPTGGEVAVYFERMPEGGATVVVKDRGAGIAVADLERIFEPFVQAEAGSNRRFGGLGLGLAIARKIARFHGGDISLESALGVGTIARFKLPAERVRWPKARAA